MELNTTLIAVIIITSLVSSMLSLGGKLIYDGIKAKRNGSNGSSHISMDLALLAKDIDFNNSRLAKIESGIDKLVELSIAAKEQSNTHLIDLKAVTVEQTKSFRTLISALTAAMARLESKLG